jgi:hypothetical protein
MIENKMVVGRVGEKLTKNVDGFAPFEQLYYHPQSTNTLSTIPSSGFCQINADVRQD